MLKLTDLVAAFKRNIKSNWTFDTTQMPPRKNAGPKQLPYFEFTCGKCNTKHWVEWQKYKDGRTNNCYKCKRKGPPSMKKMMDLRKKHGTFWYPTEEFRQEANGRRSVKMICRCGLRKWVLWNQFQTGRSRGCRSCMNIAGRHGGDFTFTQKHPLHQTWTAITRWRRTNNHWKKGKTLKFGWTTFQDFKGWALANNYTDGATLVRLNRRRGWFDTNCKWEPKVKDDNLLPKGLGI